MTEVVNDVVKNVLVAIKNVDPTEVVPSANLSDDLGVDSLDAIEIILALESHYDKELEEETLENLVTVGDIVELVRSLVE